MKSPSAGEREREKAAFSRYSSLKEAVIIILSLSLILSLFLSLIHSLHHFAKWWLMLLYYTWDRERNFLSSPLLLLHGWMDGWIPSSRNQFYSSLFLLGGCAEIVPCDRHPRRPYRHARINLPKKIGPFSCPREVPNTSENFKLINSVEHILQIYLHSLEKFR